MVNTLSKALFRFDVRNKKNMQSISPPLIFLLSLSPLSHTHAFFTTTNKDYKMLAGPSFFLLICNSSFLSRTFLPFLASLRKC